MREEMRVGYSKSTFKSTFIVLTAATGVLLTVNAVRAEEAPAKSATEKTIQNVMPDADKGDVIPIAPLSLEQVLAYAFDHNPQRQSAWSAAKAARARIKSAKADGGLQVGLTGSASNQWGFGKVGTYIPSGGGSNSKGWRESLSVDATLPIYSGGRVKANKKVATYNYQMAIAQAISTEQDLVFNATLGYLDILRNKQLVDVSQANLDVANERHRVATVRFNAGAAAKLEVLRAATDQATAEQDLVAAQNALKQSRATLNTIMGRKPQTPLRVQPLQQLTLPPSLMAPLVYNGKSDHSAASGNQGTTSLANGEQLAVLAATNSPTLAALQAQVRAAEASVDVAKAAKKPSLGISLTGLLSNPVSYLGRFLLSLGGSVVQNLFDSGRTSAEVRSAKATVDQLKGSLYAGELSVANQIEQSLLALNSAKERETTTQTAVASAQEALRAAQLGYSAGVQTSLDVSDAEAALLTAQTNAVNARFDVAASQAQLAAAVGVLTSEGQHAYQDADAGAAFREIADKGNKKDKKKKKK